MIVTRQEKAMGYFRINLCLLHNGKNMFLCMEKVCYDDRNKQRGADTYMDIAALSVVMSQQQVKTDASIAIMKQAKDVMQNEGEQLIEMIEESAVPHPNLGHQVDVKV